MEVDRAAATVHCLHVVLSRIAPMKVMSPALTSAFRVSVDCRVCLDCLSCVRVRHCLLGVAFSFFFNAAATPPSPYLLGRASASTSLPALHHRNAPAPVLPAAPTRLPPFLPASPWHTSLPVLPQSPTPSSVPATVARRCAQGRTPGLRGGPWSRRALLVPLPCARSRQVWSTAVVPRWTGPQRRRGQPPTPEPLHLRVLSALPRAHDPPAARSRPAGAVAPPIRAPPCAEVLSTSPRATTTVSPAP